MQFDLEPGMGTIEHDDTHKSMRPPEVQQAPRPAKSRLSAPQNLPAPEWQTVPANSVPPGAAAEGPVTGVALTAPPFILVGLNCTPNTTSWASWDDMALEEYVQQGLGDEWRGSSRKKSLTFVPRKQYILD